MRATSEEWGWLGGCVGVEVMVACPGAIAKLCLLRTSTTGM